MTDADFRVMLIASSFIAVRFGQQFVTQKLPFEFRYQAHLNYSCDDHATQDDVLYPEDEGRVVWCDSEDDVVTLLSRNDRCPQWIDIAVSRIGDTFTELQLLCCGRFTNDRNKMYYSDRGTGPFGIKSPNLPFDYQDGTTFLLPESEK